MATNIVNLHKAKNAKNDEFYTQYADVEKEMGHYKPHFKDKIVYCNCDDPTYSAFWKYFHIHFAELGLKKLVSTHYDTSGSTFKMEYTGGYDSNIGVGVVVYLKGNGDFRSQECLDVLNEADIVVTNPPFSLFKEFLSLMVEHDKKFIIWGNNNAISYKESFSLLKENKMWLGYIANKTCTFRVGSGYSYDEKLTNAINDGYKYGKVPSISVFTNLDISKRHEKLELSKIYTPNEYPKYDNYNAINVSKVADIPCDYDDEIGVPITFLDKYCPEQFEIIGLLIDYVGKYFVQGTPVYTDEKHKHSTCAVLNGKRQYAKLLIKRRTS